MLRSRLLLRPPRFITGVRFHGHSHGHGHSHSGTTDLLIKQGGNLRSPGVRITYIGLATNIGMALVKGVGGFYFHSQSLVADSIHAISDSVSDVLTLATVSVSRRPPSVLFPKGYGRIETVGALGVSFLLLGAGFSMGFGSLSHLLSALEIDFTWAHFLKGLGHSHSHGTEELADWNAAWIALISIAIKESLFRATYRIGKESNSPVLIANSWHHRVDCFASAIAVCSVVGGQLFGVSWLDSLGGIIVSSLVVRAGWPSLRSSCLELAGSVEPAYDSNTKKEEIINRASVELKSLSKEKYSVGEIIIEPYGPGYVVTLQLENVDADVSAVAKDVRASLLQIEGLKQVYITVTPTLIDKPNH